MKFFTQEENPSRKGYGDIKCETNKPKLNYRSDSALWMRNDTKKLLDDFLHPLMKNLPICWEIKIFVKDLSYQSCFLYTPLLPYHYLQNTALVLIESNVVWTCVNVV